MKMQLMEQKSKHFELEVESKLKNLAIIGDFIANAMKQLGIEHTQDIFKVQLAVDEACTNIIKHAYTREGEGQIIICCSLSDNTLLVTIKDWGKCFAPNSVPRPNTKAALSERKEGGLGIFLMRELMSEIRFTFNKEEGNKLTMIKHLGKTVR